MNYICHAVTLFRFPGQVLRRQLNRSHVLTMPRVRLLLQIWPWPQKEWDSYYSHSNYQFDILRCFTMTHLNLVWNEVPIHIPQTHRTSAPEEDQLPVWAVWLQGWSQIGFRCSDICRVHLSNRMRKIHQKIHLAHSSDPTPSTTWTFIDFGKESMITITMLLLRDNRNPSVTQWDLETVSSELHWRTSRAALCHAANTC